MERKKQMAAGVGRGDCYQVWRVGGPQLLPLQPGKVDGLEEGVLGDVAVQRVDDAQPVRRVLLQQLDTVLLLKGLTHEN